MLERALLVGLETHKSGRVEVAESMDELAMLVASAGGEVASALAGGGFGGIYQCGKVDFDESSDSCGCGDGESVVCHFGSNDPTVPHAEWGEGFIGRYGGILKKASDPFS